MVRWQRQRGPWERTTSAKVYRLNQHRKTSSFWRPLPFAAYPILIVIGMPAAALVWNAAGRPLPSIAQDPAAGGVRIIRGGVASGGAFDGRTAIIIDGDTIALGRERIRVLNIDAPESHEPRCDRELAAGLKAKERFAQLVRVEVVSISRSGQDRHGRTLATLSAGGRDIGAILVAEGLALPWRDGRQAWEERRRHWCG